MFVFCFGAARRRRALTPFGRRRWPKGLAILLQLAVSCFAALAPVGRVARPCGPVGRICLLPIASCGGLIEPPEVAQSIGLALLDTVRSILRSLAH